MKAVEHLLSRSLIEQRHPIAVEQVRLLYFIFEIVKIVKSKAEEAINVGQVFDWVVQLSAHHIKQGEWAACVKVSRFIDGSFD